MLPATLYPGWRLEEHQSICRLHPIELCTKDDVDEPILGSFLIHLCGFDWTDESTRLSGSLELDNVKPLGRPNPQFLLYFILSVTATITDVSAKFDSQPHSPERRPARLSHHAVVRRVSAQHCGFTHSQMDKPFKKRVEGKGG